MTDTTLEKRPPTQPASPEQGLRVLCISDSDTRMKWTIAVAEAIGPVVAAARPDLGPMAMTVASISSGALPSDRQLDENGVTGPYLVVADVELAAVLDRGFDVVVVNTVGSRLRRVFGAVSLLFEDRSERPLVVTGYAGLVYEKHVEGILWRLGADIICCNSATDVATFTEVVRGVGFDPSALVQTGAAVVDAARGSVDVSPSSPPHVVTFAVQPDVPRRRDDRVYLLERLVGYARRHPDREVVVKLRAHPGETTTHRERHHYERLYRSSIVDRPRNLTFEYGNMADVLARTDVLLTVSSTAAVEALALGIPAAVLTDVGVGESLGNHIFLGSGLLASMSDIDSDRIPIVDPGWAQRHGLSYDDDLDNVGRRVVAHLLRRDAGDTPALPDRYVDEERTPRLVARLDVASSPTTGGADRGRCRTLAAAFVRGPLRRAGRRLDRMVGV